MSKVSPAAVQSVLDLTRPALQAETATQFMAGIKSGFDALYDGLVADTTKKRMLPALEVAFTQSRGSIRQRRVLELCAWPIFDKPALPSAPGAMPEFLWLFCLPFVVRFGMKDIQQPVLLQGDVVDARSMLHLAAESGWLNPKAVLSGFPALLTREDLHLYGPKNLASLFVHSEMGEDEGLQSMPLVFDDEIESGRVATVYLVGAARLPVGENHLLNKQAEWPAAESMARLVHTGLTECDLEVESVVSYPPCSMAEALFRCAGAGLQEFATVLSLAKEHYGAKDLILRHPMEGMAELTCTDKDGDEISLLPPFPFIEPKQELQACMRRLCRDLDIEFKGAFSVAVATGSMLH